MSNEKAFPNPHLRDDAGMTLRDYFAARAEGTYWDGIRSDMEYIVYITAHHKRMERVARIKEREKNT